MQQIEIPPEASHELDVSADWYLQQNPEIADPFLDAIKAAIQTIAFDPGRFAKLDSQHHFIIFLKFPFPIVHRSCEMARINTTHRAVAHT